MYMYLLAVTIDLDMGNHAKQYVRIVAMNSKRRTLAGILNGSMISWIPMLHVHTYIIIITMTGPLFVGL